MTPAMARLNSFLAFDYSQIEIRVLAEYSNDPLLIKQFQSGEDIHSLVGHELTGWPVARIRKDKDTRTAVKEFHFSIVFGVSKPSMYQHLLIKGVKTTRTKADAFYDRYFERYPGVRRYIREQRRKAERLGYVETLFGFRRPIEMQDDRRGSYWGNQAVNTPIQGTAHQLVLIALALLHLKPRTYALLQRPIKEVHDALYFRVRTIDLPAAYQQGKHLLEQGVVAYAARHFKRILRVPLIAEASAGYCLGSMVDYTGGSVEEFLQSWRAKHLKVGSQPEALLAEV